MMMLLAVSAPPFLATGTLAAGQTLTVRDVNGNVHVRDGRTLTIKADRHARHGDPNAVIVRVDRTSDGTIVCVRYPNEGNRPCDEHGDMNVKGGDNDTQVDFDITVPAGAIVDATTVNGGIDARHDGSLVVTDVNGSVDADARSISRAVTVNGSLRLRLREAGREPLSATTVNGSIELAVPANLGLTVDARTLTGEIDVPGLNVERPRYGPGARVHGSLGDGALHASLKTVNGSVTVRR